MYWIYLALFMIHIAICVAVWISINSGVLKVHKYMFFIVAFLPFWGLILTLMIGLQIGLMQDGTKSVDMDKMKIESELYKSVAIDDKKISDITIPMEEALIINNSKERRELILDVLNDNPKEYIEFLQKAGDNDDTEVVHYSVTAMVEIAKENDEKLHNFEKLYEKNPDDEQILQEYTEFLWNCLSKNLMQGQVEQINRGLYYELMQKKMKNNAEKEDFVKIISNELARKNYSTAAEQLDRMKTQYPVEEYYLMKIQYFAELKMGQEIKEVLEEIKKNEIYISAKGKEVIAFWEE